MNAIAHLHGALALARRRWFQADPGRRAGVVCPVISIGNLAVGGRGKTPVVAEMARLLVEMGERPAILTRGYARRDTRRDLVVVHDGVRLRADVAAAGDEPLMLARALGNVAVIVAGPAALGSHSPGAGKSPRAALDSHVAVLLTSYSTPSIVAMAVHQNRKPGTTNLGNVMASESTWSGTINSSASAERRRIGG